MKTQIGAMQWRMRDGLTQRERETLGTLTEQWDGLVERYPLKVLKENRLRTVFLLDCSAVTPGVVDGEERAERWVLKQYRHYGVYDRFRYHFFRSRAEREFHALKQLEEWSFPVPRALAFGLRHKAGVVVEGGLVMEEIPETEELVEHVNQSYGRGPDKPHFARARTRLLEAGYLVRRLHDRGVHHPDLHGANFLVRTDESGPLYLIDLHSCLFPGYVPRPWRLKGLSAVARSLLFSLPVQEVRWLLLGYQATSPNVKSFDEVRGRFDSTVELATGADATRAGVSAPFFRQVVSFERKIMASVKRSERRRLKSRTRRCLLNSTTFQVESRKGWRIYSRRSFTVDTVLSKLGSEPAGEVLKSSSRGWVAQLSVDGTPLVVKHRQYPFRRRMLSLFVQHPLLRAWYGARGLEVRGLPTAECQALFEERSFGLVVRSWLVQEALDGQSLDRYLWTRFGEESPATGERFREKQSLSSKSGHLVRKIHQAGVSKHDFSPQNILITRAEDGEAFLYLLDLDDVSFGDKVGRRQRERNLVQLGNMPEGHITTRDLLRGLRAYDAGEGAFYTRTTIGRLREALLAEAFRSINRMTRLEFLGVMKPQDNGRP